MGDNDGDGGDEIQNDFLIKMMLKNFLSRWISFNIRNIYVYSYEECGSGILVLLLCLQVTLGFELEGSLLISF